MYTTSETKIFTRSLLPLSWFKNYTPSIHSTSTSPNSHQFLFWSLNYIKLIETQTPYIVASIQFYLSNLQEKKLVIFYSWIFNRSHNHTAAKFKYLNLHKKIITNQTSYHKSHILGWGTKKTIMVKDRGWRWREILVSNSKQNSKYFCEGLRKNVLCVLNHKFLWEGFWKKIYICAKDKPHTKKRENTHLIRFKRKWYESIQESEWFELIIKNQENFFYDSHQTFSDLNQKYITKIQKFASGIRSIKPFCDLNQDLHDSSQTFPWFEPNTQKKNHIFHNPYLIWVTLFHYSKSNTHNHFYFLHAI